MKFHTGGGDGFSKLTNPSSFLHGTIVVFLMPQHGLNPQPCNSQ